MPARALALLVRGLVTTTFLLSLAALSQAQDALPLSIGENRLGALTLEQMQQTFLLNVDGGETAVIRVLEVTPGLAPELRLVSPSGVEILVADNPAQSPTLEARAAFPENGSYTIQIVSRSRMPGQFMLSLQPGPLLPETVQLFASEALRADVDANTPVRSYMLDLTTSTEPTLVIIQSAASDLGVAVHLHNLTTQRTIASSDGTVKGQAYYLEGVAAQIRIDVEATSNARSAFVICAAPVGLDTCASVIAEAGWLNDAGGGIPSTVPVPDVTSAVTSDAASCSAVSATGGAVNVRSGPSTAYTIVAGLSGDQRLVVTGQLGGGSWYRVNLDDQEAWVGASVTRLEGACDALSAVNIGPGAQLAPTQPSTAVPVPTSVPTSAPDVLVVTVTPAPTGTSTATQEPGSANLQVFYTGVRSTDLQSINRLVAGIRNDGTATSRPFTVVICPEDRLQCESAAMEPLAPGMTAEASVYVSVSSQYGVIQATIVEQ